MGSILAGVTVIPAQGAAFVEALLERQREKESVEASAIIAENISKANQQAKSAANGTVSVSKKTDSSTPAVELTSNPRTLTKVLRNNRDNVDDMNNGRLTLETTFSCSACGAAMHWSTARYCWSCGRELPTKAPTAFVEEETAEMLTAEAFIGESSSSQPLPSRGGSFLSLMGEDRVIPAPDPKPIDITAKANQLAVEIEEIAKKVQL
jgi:hypothetical protein